jgi:hypothetical protein
MSGERRFHFARNGRTGNGTVKFPPEGGFGSRSKSTLQGGNGRPDLHQRFEQIVARATVQAAQEHAAHLASLRPRTRPRTPEEARRAQRQLQKRILWRGGAASFPLDEP